MTRRFSNNGFTTLNNGRTLAVTDTATQVLHPEYFPQVMAPDYFPLRCEAEIMWVTNSMSSVWSILRGQEGTSAATHVDGMSVFLPITNDALQSFLQDASTAVGDLLTRNGLNVTGRVPIGPIGSIMLSARAPGTLAAPAAPTASGSATGGTLAAATYVYAATLVDAVGETTIGTSSASYVATGTTSSVSLTGIPLGAAGTTARKVYRSTNAGSTWALVQTLSDNSTTAWADTGAAAGAAPPTVNTTGGIQPIWTGSAPTPSAAAAAGAGTTPPAPVLSGDDLRGSVTSGTGTTPAAGAQVAVTFGQTRTVAPYVVLTPMNAATAALQPYVTAVSTTGFSIAFGIAPAASQGNTVYGVTYYAVS